MEKPLQNVRVVDCSTILAGPMVATLMGEFGAEVVKIEHPESGDPVRHHGGGDAELMWKVRNRNKKSVGIDLHDPDGQAALKSIVEEADVFVENFRPGTLEEWGLGWETLSEINPDLVMVRTTGFGQTGPYKNRPGFGTLAESMSGFAHLTGQPDGPPTLPPFGLADSFSALYSTFAAMFALYWRDVEGGTGQYIDSSILEPIFSALMPSRVAEYQQTGAVGERIGNRSHHTAPRNTYRTRDDRWVALSTSAESIAKRVLRIVGGEALVDDPRFRTMSDRVENVEELDAIIQEWMDQHTREEVIEIFEEHEAALAPVYDIADIFEDPHFEERDAIVRVADDELGELAMPGVFPKLSETPGEVAHPGPDLGEHTEEILKEYADLDDERIDELRRKGTVSTGNS